jgi:hypothetical protein
MNSICPDRIFGWAASRLNHSARSTSGKDWRRPLLRWPLNLEGITGQPRGVEIGFSAEGDHALSAALTDLSQGLYVTNRGCRSELFGKLATGGLLRILRRADLALGNRPGAVVLVEPIGSAGLDEQHFDATSSSAIGQYAGTQVRP